MIWVGAKEPTKKERTNSSKVPSDLHTHLQRINKQLKRRQIANERRWLQLICYQRKEKKIENATPLHTIRIAKVQSTDSTNVGKDTEQQELSLLVGTAIV